MKYNVIGYFLSEGFRNVFKNKISIYYKDCFIYFIIIIINLCLVYFAKNILIVSNLFNWVIFSGIIFVSNLLITFIYYKLIKKLDFLNRIIPTKLKGKIKL